LKINIHVFSVYFQRFSDVQLQMVEDNTLFVQQREKEILQIVQSIQDLNDIFKELATMIVDQVRLVVLVTVYSYSLGFVDDNEHGN